MTKECEVVEGLEQRRDRHLGPKWQDGGHVIIILPLPKRDVSQTNIVDC